MPKEKGSVLFSHTLEFLREEEEKNRPTLIRNVLDTLSKEEKPLQIPNHRPLEA